VRETGGLDIDREISMSFRLIVVAVGNLCTVLGRSTSLELRLEAELTLLLDREGGDAER